MCENTITGWCGMDGGHMLIGWLPVYQITNGVMKLKYKISQYRVYHIKMWRGFIHHTCHNNLTRTSKIGTSITQIPIRLGCAPSLPPKPSTLKIMPRRNEVVDVVYSQLAQFLLMPCAHACNMLMQCNWLRIICNTFYKISV